MSAGIVILLMFSSLMLLMMTGQRVFGVFQVCQHDPQDFEMIGTCIQSFDTKCRLPRISGIGDDNPITMTEQRESPGKLRLPFRRSLRMLSLQNGSGDEDKQHRQTGHSKGK